MEDHVIGNTNHLRWVQVFIPYDKTDDFLLWLVEQGIDGEGYTRNRMSMIRLVDIGRLNNGGGQWFKFRDRSMAIIAKLRYGGIVS